MKKFKVWNCTGRFWIEENVDDFVELKCFWTDHDHVGESFIDAKPGINVEIIWQDNYGNFIPPGQEVDI